MSPSEEMMRDSVALANLKQMLDSVGAYDADDADEDAEIEDGEEETTADAIARACYKLGDAFVKARRGTE